MVVEAAILKKIPQAHNEAILLNLNTTILNIWNHTFSSFLRTKINLWALKIHLEINPINNNFNLNSNKWGIKINLIFKLFKILILCHHQAFISSLLNFTKIRCQLFILNLITFSLINSKLYGHSKLTWWELCQPHLQTLYHLGRTTVNNKNFKFLKLQKKIKNSSQKINKNKWKFIFNQWWIIMTERKRSNSLHWPHNLI